MPLTENQKKILVASGLVVATGVTGYLIYRAVAKAPPPPPTTPPPTPPPTYPPAALSFLNLPMTIEQYYRCILSGYYPFQQHLDSISPFLDATFTHPGFLPKVVQGAVYDAMGRGVPNVSVLIWSSPTPDSYSGSLFLNGQIRSADNPLRLKTNGDGKFAFAVEYHTDLTYLANKGCRACNPIECHITKPCQWIIPIGGEWFTCGYKTPGYVYQLTGAVEGTVLTTIGVLTVYANLAG